MAAMRKAGGANEAASEETVVAEVTAQPHGAVLVLDEKSRKVVAASENVLLFIPDVRAAGGVVSEHEGASAVIGRHLSDVFTTAQTLSDLEALVQRTTAHSASACQISGPRPGQSYCVSACRTGAGVVLSVEDDNEQGALATPVAGKQDCHPAVRVTRACGSSTAEPVAARRIYLPRLLSGHQTHPPVFFPPSATHTASTSPPPPVFSPYLPSAGPSLPLSSPRPFHSSRADLQEVDVPPPLSAAGGPSTASAAPSLPFHQLARRAIDRMQSINTVSPHVHSFCDAAAQELRTLTGYDRVMIAHITDEACCKIIAESCVSELTSFRGKHFPLPPVPKIWTDEAIKQHIPMRFIYDTSAGQVPIRHVASLSTPPDLSLSPLSGVESAQRQLLRAMGVCAVLLMPLALHVGERHVLWGFVIFHHYNRPWTVTCAHRAACTFIVQVPCDGVAYVHTERAQVVTFGTCPTDDQVLGMVAWMQSSSRLCVTKPVFAPLVSSSARPGDWGPAWALHCTVAAAAIADADVLLWFRHRQQRHLDWAWTEPLTAGAPQCGTGKGSKGSGERSKGGGERSKGGGEGSEGAGAWGEAGRDEGMLLAMQPAGWTQSEVTCAVGFGVTGYSEAWCGASVVGQLLSSVVCAGSLQQLQARLQQVMAGKGQAQEHVEILLRCPHKGKPARTPGARGGKGQGITSEEDRAGDGEEEEEEEEEGKEEGDGKEGEEEEEEEVMVLMATVSPQRDGLNEIVGATMIGQDVTEQRRTMQQWAENETRAVPSDYEQILDKASMPIWAVDKDGRIVEWNASMAKTSGISKEQAVGKRIMGDLVGDERVLMVPDSDTLLSLDFAIHRALAGHRTPTINFRFVNHEGRQVESVISMRACHDPQDDGEGGDGGGGAGKGSRVLCFMQDVTMRKAVEKAMVVRHAAEAAEDAKSRHLAFLCHEIRNPLNGILGNITFMEDTRLSEEQQELVETTATCGYQLRKIVEDVLDMSQMQEGRIELERHELNLPRIVNAVVSQVGLAAAKKGLQLYANIDPRCNDVRPLGDAPRLQQILSNLAWNAIKFTHAGWVEIGIAMHPTHLPSPSSSSSSSSSSLTALSKAAAGASGKGKVGSSSSGGGGEGAEGEEESARFVFRVADSGEGIPESLKQRLFEQFATGRKSASSQYGGTGLGLSICQQLASLMGGEIKCTSEVGKGSIFSLEVQLHLLPPHTHTAHAATTPRALPAPPSPTSSSASSPPPSPSATAPLALPPLPPPTAEAAGAAARAAGAGVGVEAGSAVGQARGQAEGEAVPQQGGMVARRGGVAEGGSGEQGGGDAGMAGQGWWGGGGRGRRREEGGGGGGGAGGGGGGGGGRGGGEFREPSFQSGEAASSEGPAAHMLHTLLLNSHLNKSSPSLRPPPATSPLKRSPSTSSPPASLPAPPTIHPSSSSPSLSCSVPRTSSTPTIPSSPRPPCPSAPRSPCRPPTPGRGLAQRGGGGGSSLAGAAGETGTRITGSSGSETGRQQQQQQQQQQQRPQQQQQQQQQEQQQQQQQQKAPQQQRWQQGLPGLAVVVEQGYGETQTTPSHHTAPHGSSPASSSAAAAAAAAAAGSFSEAGPASDLPGGFNIEALTSGTQSDPSNPWTFDHTSQQHYSQYPPLPRAGNPSPRQMAASPEAMRADSLLSQLPSSVFHLARPALRERMAASSNSGIPTRSFTDPSRRSFPPRYPPPDAPPAAAADGAAGAGGSSSSSSGGGILQRSLSSPLSGAPAAVRGSASAAAAHSHHAATSLIAPPPASRPMAACADGSVEGLVEGTSAGLQGAFPGYVRSSAALTGVTPAASQQQQQQQVQAFVVPSAVQQPAHTTLPLSPYIPSSPTPPGAAAVSPSGSSAPSAAGAGSGAGGSAAIVQAAAAAAGMVTAAATAVATASVAAAAEASTRQAAGADGAVEGASIIDELRRCMKGEWSFHVVREVVASDAVAVLVELTVGTTVRQQWGAMPCPPPITPALMLPAATSQALSAAAALFGVSLGGAQGGRDVGRGGEEEEGRDEGGPGWVRSKGRKGKERQEEGGCVRRKGRSGSGSGRRELGIGGLESVTEEGWVGAEEGQGQEVGDKGCRPTAGPSRQQQWRAPPDPDSWQPPSRYSGGQGEGGQGVRVPRSSMVRVRSAPSLSLLVCPPSPSTPDPSPAGPSPAGPFPPAKPLVNGAMGFGSRRAGLRQGGRVGEGQATTLRVVSQPHSPPSCSSSSSTSSSSSSSSASSSQSSPRHLPHALVRALKPNPGALSASPLAAATAAGGPADRAAGGPADRAAGAGGTAGLGGVAGGRGVAGAGGTAAGSSAYFSREASKLMGALNLSLHKATTAPAALAAPAQQVPLPVPAAVTATVATTGTGTGAAMAGTASSALAVDARGMVVRMGGEGPAQAAVAAGVVTAGSSAVHISPSSPSHPTSSAPGPPPSAPTAIPAASLFSRSPSTQLLTSVASPSRSPSPSPSLSLLHTAESSWNCTGAARRPTGSPGFSHMPRLQPAASLPSSSVTSHPRKRASDLFSMPTEKAEAKEKEYKVGGSADCGAVWCVWVGERGGVMMHVVLVIDDEPVNIRVVRRTLERAQFEVVAGSDGTDAVERVIKCGERFDALLLDERLKVMNGSEACMRVREYEAANGLLETPIVAISANVEPDDIRRYAMAGYSAVLGKPINVRTAGTRLLALLGAFKPPTPSRRAELQQGSNVKICREDEMIIFS
ncbi:unnamed protein product [Closterium sp. NIES-53]